MKIRLALIDSDDDYRKRLSDFYIKNYHDRIEILTFSSLNSFENNRGNKTIDVMLVAEDIEEDLSLYNGKISIAYLSDRDLIERKNNIKTINKFKKPDKIYKEILNILADGANGDIAYKFNDGNHTTVEVFMSVNGGAGATSLAIAYGKKLAMKGIPTLYLNFETLNSSGIFLEGESNVGFDEIIYAIKSKKQSVSLKIESRLNVFSKLAHKIVLVFEETKFGIKKMSDLNEALQLLENGGNIDITNKLTIICNKVSDVNHVSIPPNLYVREFIKNYSVENSDLTNILAQVPFLENLR